MRVLSDKQLVQNLQQGHGGWNESMTAVRHFTGTFLCLIKYFSAFLLKQRSLDLCFTSRLKLFVFRLEENVFLAVGRTSLTS